MIYIVDPIYNPNFQSSISSATKLGPGITCAKFLGAAGSRVQFEQLDVDRKLVARQLYLQAEAIRAVHNNPDFNDNRLIVAEGVYKPAINESVTSGSINDYKKTGRAIVYQLMNTAGDIDIEKSFDLAVYWKDYVDFDELILDYDTYDPSGKLSCQLILTMPVANETFDISFQRKIKTEMNGTLLSLNELIEVLE